MKKIKKLKKIIIAAITTIVMLMMNFLGLANSVYAAELINSAKLEDIGDCGSLLTYKGVEVVTTYVAYNDGGNLYPAYCLNVNLPGVGESGSYTVSTNELITDVGLWRRVINGYPYKTLSELGCNTKEEAFTATKHAIYCYVHGDNPDNYSAIGEAGQRTLNAMKQIIANAQNSTETKIATSITINKGASNWKQDDIDKKYISKTYEVEANANYKNYTISIEKTGKSNIPEGWKITDVNNNEKTTFNNGEKFKVLIPINNLKNNGDFTLKVKSEMNTKPVLYGQAPSSNLQDYAITTLKYEDGKGSIQDSYGENTTTIIVYKKDKNTGSPLEGVTFDLLNESKEVVNSGLKTDSEGKIIIKGIMPGKYYLRETNTLDEYVIYDEDIEIDVELNEEFKVTVNNSKQIKLEVEKSEKELTVSKESEKTDIQEKTENTEIENKEIIKVENNQTVEKVQENQTIEEVQKNQTIKKLPVTGM